MARICPAVLWGAAAISGAIAAGRKLQKNQDSFCAMGPSARKHHHSQYKIHSSLTMEKSSEADMLVGRMEPSMAWGPSGTFTAGKCIAYGHITCLAQAGRWGQCYQQAGDPCLFLTGVQSPHATPNLELEELDGKAMLQ